MGKNKRFILFVFLILTLMFGVGPSNVRAAATFVVNDNGNAVDANLGDGLCLTGGGVCTLRAAIQQANANPDIDTIAFDLGGAFVTIFLNSELDEIIYPVLIDGQSQLGFAGSPVVALDGSSAGGGADGLRITAGNSTVRGLVIRDFGGDGIELSGNAGSNSIYNNYIGTDFLGTGAAANGNGIRISDSPSNVIGGTTSARRNLISGNTGYGILVTNVNSIGNAITGNYIGTHVNGLSAIPNGSDGVRVIGAANTSVGNTGVGAGNLISGNGTNGVNISGVASTGTTVQGNIIGLDKGGDNPLGNSNHGVNVSSSTGITIGGSTASARNLISNNGGSGVNLASNADGNFVRANYIGLNTDGDIDVGNIAQGVYINGGDNNTIGGSGAGQANVISGNGGNGVNIFNGTGNVVQGNMIGTNPSGTVAFGNDNHGVRLNASDNQVGGTSAGEGNTIAFNTMDGVMVLGTNSANRILRNSIFSNTGLGIDLGNDGVTPNDLVDGDPDGGANEQQNFPVIISTVLDGTLDISGTFNSKLGTDFRLEFYSSLNCDGSGNGEGGSFFYSVDITTDGVGDYAINESVSASVSEGDFITVTATSYNGVPALEDTSEFSACSVVTAPPAPPSAGVFVVNVTTNGVDVAPGDGFCADGGGNCSLRAAIEEANAGAGPYTIAFNIPGIGPHVITPVGVYDEITTPVIIDGTTEPDYSGTPVVVIDGTSTPGGPGLNISAGNSTVRGLVINNFSTGIGIRLSGNDSNNIEGNFIGTNITGYSAGPNLTGILINNVPNNTIGGTSASERNLISGNFGDGIQILNSNATGNVITGNYIGVNVAGTGTLNNGTGVYINDAPGNTVGGSSSSRRNVISSNTNGVRISGNSAAGNVVASNYIGTDKTGLIDLGNTFDGVRIEGAPSNVIGGSGQGNVISGNNNDGIEITGGLNADGNIVYGNYVGLASDGTSSLLNSLYGISISNGYNNDIGGISGGQGNTVAFNQGAGVTVLAGTGNTIAGNSIYSNVGLGIDLAPFGPNINDPGDVDGGANNRQNKPFVTLAGSGFGETILQGLLDTEPNKTYRLDFYYRSFCDGEGANYQGSGNATTDGSGFVFFDIHLAGNLPLNYQVTATATDLTTGDTSELSPCVPVTIAPAATPTPSPTITLTPTITQTPVNTAVPPTNTPVPPTSTSTLGSGATITTTVSINTLTPTGTGTQYTATSTLSSPEMTLTALATANAPSATTTLSVLAISPTSTLSPTFDPSSEGQGGGGFTSTPTSTVTRALNVGQLTGTAQSEAEAAVGDAAGGFNYMILIYVCIGVAILLLLAGAGVEVMRWLNSRRE